MHGNQPLVSIVTPCWNGESYVSRFLDCVFAQTYSNLELIVVNDGSTDKTEEIVRTSFPKLEARGIPCTLINQENGGQAVAMNAGLAVMKGDYFTHVDSDDVLAPDFVEKMSAALQANPECDLAVCKVRHVIEGTGETTRVTSLNYQSGMDVIQAFVQEKVHLLSGMSMIRTSAFLRAYPNRQISPFRDGQNIQIYFPLLVEPKIVAVDEILHTYYIRGNSHSHGSRTYESHAKRFKAYHEIMEGVIPLLNTSQGRRGGYLSLAREKTSVALFKLALRYFRRGEAMKLWPSVRQSSKVHFGHRLKYRLLTLAFWRA